MTESKGGCLTVLSRLSLGLLSAVLLGIYASWPALAFVPYSALVPWLLLYTDDRRPKTSLAYYFVSVYIGWVLLYPVLFRFGLFVPFSMGIVLFLPMLVFAPLLRRIHQRFRLPRVLSVPVVWVAVEWFRATCTMAHFDLFGLGYSQARYQILIQIADVVGVYGVSFLVAAVNGLIADVLFAFRDAGWSVPGVWSNRRVRWGAVAVASGFLVVSVYGVLRLGRLESAPGPRLAVVQPNLRHSPNRNVSVHLGQVLLTAERVEPGIDLIVWPENAILEDLGGENTYVEDLAWLSRSKGAPLLLGAMAGSASRPGRNTNAAFLIDREGAILGRYDKQVLFPWSEYLPLDDLLRRLAPPLYRAQRKIARKGWGSLAAGVAGREMTLFSLPWGGEPLKFASLICFENTYPPVPAEAARMGARFFVNITSEGTVSGPIQEQLLRICILRAVENRMAYVRAGNTGISCFIDPGGRVRRVLRGDSGRAIDDSGVLVDRISLSPTGLTIYARSRDAVALLTVLATVALYLWSLLSNSRRTAGGLAVVSLLVAAAGCAPVPELGTDPEAAAAALERGRQLVQAGPRGCPEAIESFASACAETEACGEALPFIADCFRATEEWEVGSEFLEAVASEHPELEGVALGYRGFFLDRSGFLVEAEQAYRRSLTLKESPLVYRLLGELQMRLPDRAGAITTLRKGLSLVPDDTGLRFLLGRNLRREGELADAKLHLEQVLSSDPGYGSAWVELGRVRAAEGDDRGAVEAYLRGARADPESIEARFMLAKKALRESRFDELERLLGEIRAIEATLGRGVRTDG